MEATASSLPVDNTTVNLRAWLPLRVELGKYEEAEPYLQDLDPSAA
jgi:hypothetical protein